MSEKRLSVSATMSREDRILIMEQHRLKGMPLSKSMYLSLLEKAKAWKKEAEK